MYKQNIPPVAQICKYKTEGAAAVGICSTLFFRWSLFLRDFAHEVDFFLHEV